LSKANRSDKRAQDYVVNKLLCVFTLAFLLILGLMNVSRMMSRADSYVSAFTAMPYITAAFAVLTVLCIIWAIVAKAKGVDTSFRLITGKHFAFVFGFCTLCAALLSFSFNKGMLTFLYVLIPAVAVLYIIFYSYPRDFFVIAMVSCLGAIAVWVLAVLKTNGLYPVLFYVCNTLASIALIAAIILTAIAQVSSGKLFGVNFFDSKALYALLYVTYALVLAAVNVAAAFGTAVLYFAAFGLVGYLVVVGICYTVRQI